MLVNMFLVKAHLYSSIIYKKINWYQSNLFYLIPLNKLKY